VNLSALNKKQKEALMLAVMGLVTTGVVLQNIVLGPRQKQAAEARKTMEEIGPDLRSGESMLNRDRNTRLQLQRLSGEMLQVAAAELPPPLSRYTWALGRISAASQEQALFPQIREHLGQRFTFVRRDASGETDPATFWVPYAVEIDFQAGYDQTRAFLEKLLEQNTYASVAQLSIRTNPADPERHLVNLLVEWPVPRFAEDLALLNELGAAP
jgi:hypothetical protein